MGKLWNRWGSVLLVFATSFSCLFVRADEKHFVIVIPSYNNKDWCQRNLGSVLTQKYHNFRVIYIDDASSDGTGALVDSYVQRLDSGHRVTVIHNEERHGSLCNLYQAIWSCSPGEIVVDLDGDDWLAHERVLEKLNSVYADPAVWMTYGQFAYYPGGSSGWSRQLPDDVIQRNVIRYYDWVSTHLRTFYAGLFQKIRKEDLQYNGDFFSMAGDLAFMWPMLEMAGHHSRFIPDVLYIYNVANVLNDHKVSRELQLHYSYVIRSRRPYEPVTRVY